MTENVDVVWIIFDSLSFEATPFPQDGPNTMPILAELAGNNAEIFTRAYAPGPTSPSSHGSFFTGELPSTTGMHEAHPYFDFDGPTVASELNESHRTHLISSNQFLFNGLDEAFDEAERLGVWSPKFSAGTNPMEFDSNQNGIKKYLDFLLANGTPVRSLLNGIQFKTRDHWGAAGNYANDINEYLYDSVVDSDNNAFAVANYMDVHPPLTASDEALSKFAPDWPRDELPIGVRGRDIYEKYQSDPDYTAEDMYALYKAAVWDLDRKVAPLVSDIIDRNALVIVTADHGHGFRRDTEFEDRRIHVPLLVFSPESNGRERNETVNLRSLPKTTLAALNRDTGRFCGTDLLNQSRSQLSITEFVYNDQIGVRPVPPDKNRKHTAEPRSITYRITGIRNGTRIDYDGHHYPVVTGDDSDDITQIKEDLKNIHEEGVNLGETTPEYDNATEEHLRKLGYL